MSFTNSLMTFTLIFSFKLYSSVILFQGFLYFILALRIVFFVLFLKCLFLLKPLYFSASVPKAVNQYYDTKANVLENVLLSSILDCRNHSPF